MNTCCGDSEPEVLDSVLNDTQNVFQTSWNEHWAFTPKNHPAWLHNTRSGKCAFRPLTMEQRNQLQATPMDTLYTYINNMV